MAEPHPPERSTPDVDSSGNGSSAVPTQNGKRGALSVRARAGGEGVKQARTAREFSVSVALHAVVGLVLLQFLTFGHGWANFLGLGKDRERREERITYIAPRQKPDLVAKVQPKPVETKPTTAPRLAAPSTGPVLGAPTPPEPVAARADTGSANPTDGAKGVGALDPNLRGVKPDYTDVRVWRGTGGGGAASAGVASGRNGADRLDSIMKFAITSAADSLDAAARANGAGGRRPGDWTKTDADGNKWGWDGTGIRLGKVTIPNALLGLLPLNAQRGLSGNYTQMQNDKRLALAREDIMRNVDRTLGEAEFKKLVGELRERREKERRDRLRAPDASVVNAKQSPPEK